METDEEFFEWRYKFVRAKVGTAITFKWENVIKVNWHWDIQIFKGTRLFHFKNGWFVSIVSDDNHNNIFKFDHVQVIMVVGVS